MSAAEVPQAPEAVDVEFREARPSDEALINSAFLRGMRDCPYTSGLPNDLYFDTARYVWDKVQREMGTIIAHVPGDPGEVMGYVTHRPDLTYDKDINGDVVRSPGIAYLTVARAWRRMGVGKRLLAQAGIRPRQKFAVLFGNPRALAWFRSKDYHPAFTPFVTWRWLVEYKEAA